MVLTGKAVLPLVIMVAALIAAAIHVRTRGSELSQANMIAMPMIGDIKEVNREGPWPECVGKSFSQCSEMIESYSKQSVRIELVKEHDKKDCKDFDAARVCLFVDDSGVVASTPHKG